MSIEITFVRHGETDANAASIWQGQGDAALSAIGRAQAAALGDRLAPIAYDRVVSSDLARTTETAQLAGLDPELDPAWREMDIGQWEGLTRDEVHQHFPAQVERLASGDQNVLMGGGESWSGFRDRVVTAVAELVETTKPGSRVLVMAHGGVIHAALSWGLGFSGRRPWPISRIRNTGITEVIASADMFHLQALNDARHAPVVTGNEGEPGEVVRLIRHGESAANVAGRWHGRTDGSLTQHGVMQAATVAADSDGASRVFASPLRRAVGTAEPFAARSGLPVELAGGLIEIDFGAWEDLTTSEIEERFPDAFDRVFNRGEDLPRGETGETFAEAGARVESEVRRLIAHDETEHLVLFTHGGAIWALAARLMGIDWGGWSRLAIPANVSTTRLRLDGSTLVLVDYNLGLL